MVKLGIVKDVLGCRAGDTMRFWVVRQGGRIRWVIPLRTGSGRWLSRLWRPYGSFSYIIWHLMVRFYSLRLPQIVPKCEILSLGDVGVDWRKFGWRHSHAPIPIFFFSSPGKSQKMIMFLRDPGESRRDLAVKIPLGDDSWSKILNEYDTIKKLYFYNNVSVAEPIAIEGVQKFSVQAVIQGEPAPVTFTRKHSDFLRALRDPSGFVSVAELQRTLRQEIYQLGSTRHIPTEAERVFQSIIEQDFGVARLPAVRCHGDFAPWNLRVQPNGNIIAVDWEDSFAPGLPFYDALHYQLRVASLLGRRIELDLDDYVGDVFGRVGCAAASVRASYYISKASLILRELKQGTWSIVSSSVSRLWKPQS